MANPPTVAGFLTFIRGTMGISAVYLPDSSPIIQHVFDQATNIVLDDLAIAASRPGSYTILELATYNLAGHLLIEFAPDQSFGIISASWSAGLVTLVTVTNTIQVGDKVLVNGISPNVYNGAYVVNSVIDPTHLTYAIAPNPGAASPSAIAAITQRYFALIRQQVKIISFVPGAVGNTSDVSTSVGLVSPDFLRGLTMYDLDLLKTPYGRRYLSFAQGYGPNVWGVS